MWRRLPFALALLLTAWQIAAILMRNGGDLTYSLDDPYIHLGLSENIARGHYGIEPNEHSAPSSSALWPFLLALGAALAMHEALPLLLNLAALLATIQLLSRLMSRCRMYQIPGGEAFAAGLLTLLALTLNLTGLALTGMEHSLQVVLAMAVVLGMIVISRDRPTPPYLLAAIIIGPMVRYESAALSATALLLLVIRGRWRTAILTAAACLVILGSFSLFLMHLDLEPLPGPVLENLEATGGSVVGDAVTSETVPGETVTTETDLSKVLAHIWTRLKWILSMLPARLLASLTGVLIAVALTLPRRDATLLLCGAVAPLLHLGFGSFGGFARYEIYILTSVVALLIYGLRQPLRDLVAARGPAVSLLAVGAVLFPVFSSYATVAYLTPQAAHNIHQQHDQIHRFVTEHYRRPVAVNDLGRVSYRNPDYVLDLWGLCSTEVRRARLDRDPAWPAAFVERHDIELAMIYESWFKGRIPATWRRIASLQLQGKRITPGSATVSFYLTRSGSADEIFEHLHRFSATLPADTALEIDTGFIP